MWTFSTAGRRRRLKSRGGGPGGRQPPGSALLVVVVVAVDPDDAGALRSGRVLLQAHPHRIQFLELCARLGFFGEKQHLAVSPQHVVPHALILLVVLDLKLEHGVFSWVFVRSVFATAVLRGLRSTR